MKKSKKGLDCVSMKRSIQEQISKEMKGMSPAQRLAYIKRQVQTSPFADAFPLSCNPACLNH